MKAFRAYLNSKQLLFSGFLMKKKFFSPNHNNLEIDFWLFSLVLRSIFHKHPRITSSK